jgi:hypothetical protein
MFEVVISVVTTGRVRRRTFASRDQAGQYANEQLDQWANKKRSARDLRVEILAKEAPAPRPPFRPSQPRRAA